MRTGLMARCAALLVLPLLLGFRGELRFRTLEFGDREVKATVTTRASSAIEVEVVPAGSGFKGEPTHTGPIFDTGSGICRIDRIKAGTYDWQARIVEIKGRTSAWRRGGKSIRVDRHHPDGYATSFGSGEGWILHRSRPVGGRMEIKGSVESPIIDLSTMKDPVLKFFCAGACDGYVHVSDRTVRRVSSKKDAPHTHRLPLSSDWGEVTIAFLTDAEWRIDGMLVGPAPVLTLLPRY